MWPKKKGLICRNDLVSVGCVPFKGFEPLRCLSLMTYDGHRWRYSHTPQCRCPRTQEVKIVCLGEQDACKEDVSGSTNAGQLRTQRVFVWTETKL